MGADRCGLGALGEPQTLNGIQDNPRKEVTWVRAPKARPHPQEGPLTPHWPRRLGLTAQTSGP